MHIKSSQALQKLSHVPGEFLDLFSHGSLSLEIYKPEHVDKQKPHSRDEVYVIVAGSGDFFNAGERVQFGPGDFLFVKAGEEHYFENFTEDFSTWVIFYGPEGGEKDT